MRPFIRPNRKQLTLMPPSIEEWLPEKHLARFVVEITEELDLTHIYRQYSIEGSPPYDPRMLLGLLFYGYATGVCSSRKIEAATYDSVAFRYISGNLHPDHDTIAQFRKRFLSEMERLFVEILLVAKAMGMLKVGNVNIDGTKVQASASKHKAMSYQYIEQLEKSLEEEVSALLKLAEQTDLQEDEQGLDIPEELSRREDRLAKIRQAKAVLQQRAKERYEAEKAEYDAKVKARAEKEKATGKKPGGTPPKPPEEGPRPKDQYNFTDPESRIMKTSNGFDQCYNAQAVVTDEMLIVGGYVNAHGNDKEELLPALDSVSKKLGKIKRSTADTGYFSEEAVAGAEKRGVDPYIATGRQRHNQWLKRELEAGQRGEENQDQASGKKKKKSVKEKMREKLKTPEGKAIYRLRKMTVEPVFGIIKEAMGFRRFSLRGEEKVDGEWKLICASYNLKRMFNLAMA
jgi:transposase